MIKYRLPALILFMSLLYIFVIPSDPYVVKILFKLIPMWLIIAYAYLHKGNSWRRYHTLILIGLFFCMLGDGLLRWFVVGLSLFLIGHLCYMNAFFSRWRFSRIRFAMIIPIGLYSFLIGREIIQALIQDGKDSLIIPVVLYVIVIGLMTWSAIMTGYRWAIIGSVLFTISDSILSWNLFVSSITYSGPLIMITYYSAQFLIAYSIRNNAVDKNRTTAIQATHS